MIVKLHLNVAWQFHIFYFPQKKIYIPSTSHVKTIYSFQYIRLYSNHITQVTKKNYLISSCFILLNL